jgi:hypothetical protein
MATTGRDTNATKNRLNMTKLLEDNGDRGGNNFTGSCASDAKNIPRREMCGPREKLRADVAGKRRLSIGASRESKVSTPHA